MPPLPRSLSPTGTGRLDESPEPEDVQSRPDERPVPLAAAGIRGLRLPSRLRLDGREIPTLATYTLAVGLPPGRKGVHMSRLVACAHAWSRGFDPFRPDLLLASLRKTQPAPRVEFAIDFPYHREKLAPVSGAPGWMEYAVAVRGRHEEGRGDRCVLGLAVPVTTLCPCSRDISEYGAHNQRSWVRASLAVEPARVEPDLDALLARIEAEGSCELYAVLKRADEKYVTERAYARPKFSEDLARDVALALQGLPGLELVSVDVENLESIHAHTAFARYEEVAEPLPPLPDPTPGGS
jgi:GTP cyclohydrolase I